MMMTPLWRKAYDAIERPLTAGSEAWVQSDTFMPVSECLRRAGHDHAGGVL